LTLVEHARAGDPRAHALLAAVAAELGQVLVGSLVNLLNPSRIVLGGELTAAGEHLLGPLRRYLSERAWASPFDPSALAVSRLGPRAIAVGAATAYLDEALRKPEQFLFPSAAV
jgi:predicted NBD/HSP70 family sugar kinase